jgi:uncharacterized protein (DUF488 family)
VIYTIGHSIHSAEAFTDLLHRHEVRQVADVRTVPRSKRHPQFEGARLSELLSTEGIAYRHFPALGGFRKPHADSANTAWQHPAFRGYADYMATPVFQSGLDALIQFTQAGTTVVMCAEATWWRCHRRLLADALVVRGEGVSHIMSSAAPKPHELSEFAKIDGPRVTYPGLL